MPNNHQLADAIPPAFRRPRWPVLVRRLVPLVLLAAGTGAVVYGGFYHRIAVTETHEEHKSRPDPRWVPPMPPGMAGPPGMGGPLPGMPGPPFDMSGPPPNMPGQPGEASRVPPDALAPPPQFKPPMIELIETTTTTTPEPELEVNLAVTVAGIVRDPQGQIVRVSGAAAGPGFCPS